MKQQYHPILIQEFKKTFPKHILGMFFHAIVIFMMLKIPSIIGTILDMLLEGNVQKEQMMQQVYLLIFYSVILVIPRSICRTLYFTVARKTDTKLRKEVVKQLEQVKPEYFEQEEKGVFLAYLSRELLLIRKFLGNFFHYTTKFIITPIIAMIMIAIKFNMWLALSILPIFPIVLGYIYYEYKTLQQAIENSRKSYVEFSKTIEQNTSGFSLIKLYNEQENQKKKFNAINEEVYQNDYQIGVEKNKISNAMNLLYGGCYIIGFCVGLYLVSQNKITVGELTAYISYISFAVSDVISAIFPLANGIAYFKQSTKRYNYFFDLETYPKQGNSIQTIREIEIKDLTYQYRTANKPCLAHINMKIKQGEKIGIIGQVGSGKTTLMNIISGLYEVKDGTVFINQKDINTYSKDAIFHKIGYATQKNVILNDTIENNITMETTPVEEPILQEILQQAQLREDVEQMVRRYSNNNWRKWK